MAVLDNNDFTEIKQYIRSSPYWNDLKSMGLDKQSWYDVFQAAEDWFTNGFNVTPTESFKSAIDTAAGVSLTNPQAIAIGKVWMHWRVSK